MAPRAGDTIRIIKPFPWADLRIWCDNCRASQPLRGNISKVQPGGYVDLCCAVCSSVIATISRIE